LFHLGNQRIAYAHTECTWTTILATEEKDPELIEAQFTVATQQEFLEFTDFVAAIAEYGFDPETARRVSENTSDQIEMPNGSYKFVAMTPDLQFQMLSPMNIAAIGAFRFDQKYFR